MKKLLYVSGSRAEYGIMKRLLKKLDEDSEISLDIVVTGMHLLKEYGETYKEVEKEFKITKKVNIEISNKNNYEILHSMSIAMEEFSKYFRDNSYDALILLGDRYEILPVAITAAFNNIPIIHIHGGEKTLGNYDEFIRHSITKMSKLHLVATEEYRKRVIQLGESPNTVKNLGSLGVANILEMKLFNKKELEDIIEEIFGDINDEHDANAQNFKRIDENTFEFRGRFEIEGVEEVMGIDFDEETEQLTIGGYVFNLFGSLPEIGDKISDENCDYEVLRMDGTRVSLVKAIKKVVAQPQENEEAEKNN